MSPPWACSFRMTPELVRYFPSASFTAISLSASFTASSACSSLLMHALLTRQANEGSVARANAVCLRAFGDFGLAKETRPGP